MAYIPPYLRNSQPCQESKSANTFKNVDNSSAENEKELLLNTEEAFPSLGNTKDLETSSLNFAASLFIPQPKPDEPEKDIPDGWVRLKKNGEIVYGDKSKYYDEFEKFLDHMDEVFHKGALECILNRYEEYERLELLLNGPKYLDCWEVTQYIENKKAEAKARFRNNLESDESNDEDNTINEFN